MAVITRLCTMATTSQDSKLESAPTVWSRKLEDIPSIQIEEYRSLFEAIDLDGNGTISVSELSETFADMNISITKVRIPR